MFSTIVDITMKIVDFINENEKSKKEDKERIGKILGEISDIILDTAVKLKKDEYPHNNCVVLERLSNNLHFSLIDYVEQDELDKLHQLLIESSNIEKLYAYRHNKDIIRDLMKISGEIKAMSILLLV
jgi:hypothetical protein